MIKSKADLKFYIEEDKKRNLWQPNRSYLFYLAKLLYGSADAKAYHYMKSLRKYEYILQCKKTLTSRMLRLWRQWRLNSLSVKYNTYIGANMVGYGFRIRHIGGGLVINCLSMGNYCSASCWVLVGNKDSQENRATIGENVILTPGAKIIGKVAVGNNCVIAPNSVVVKDVPDNCVVSGIPAKIIKKDGQKFIE